MQPYKKIFFTFCFTFSVTFFVLGQSCKCDSAIQNRSKTWDLIIKNSNEIKIINISNRKSIKTEKQKTLLIKRLTSDTAIVAFPCHSIDNKKTFLRIGRYDTLTNRRFRIPDYDIDTTKGKPFLAPGDTVPMQSVKFGDKQLMAKEMIKMVKLNDSFYEVTFQINNKLYYEPVICLTEFSTLIDNIFFNIQIRKKE